MGEPLLNPLISYADMKTNYLIRIIELRDQPDHITPKKIQLLQEYSTDPDNARLFSKLIRRREIELISDGNKLFEVKVIKMKILIFKDFMKEIDLDDDTMNESQLQRICIYPIYPKDSKINSDKGFVDINNGSQGSSHWIVFISKRTNHITLIHLVVSLIVFY